MIRREPAGPAPRTFAVVGGAGAMGRITVRDLAETCAPTDELLVADHDLARAEALATSLTGARRPRIRAVRIDVNIKQPQLPARQLSRCCHRQTRPPGAFVPG